MYNLVVDFGQKSPLQFCIGNLLAKLQFRNWLKDVRFGLFSTHIKCTITLKHIDCATNAMANAVSRMQLGFVVSAINLSKLPGRYGYLVYRINIVEMMSHTN